MTPLERLYAKHHDDIQYLRSGDMFMAQEFKKRGSYVWQLGWFRMSPDAPKQYVTLRWPVLRRRARPPANVLTLDTLRAAYFGWGAR